MGGSSSTVCAGILGLCQEQEQEGDLLTETGKVVSLELSSGDRWAGGANQILCLCTQLRVIQRGVPLVKHLLDHIGPIVVVFLFVVVAAIVIVVAVAVVSCILQHVLLTLLPNSPNFLSGLSPSARLSGDATKFVGGAAFGGPGGTTDGPLLRWEVGRWMLGPGTWLARSATGASGCGKMLVSLL